MKQTDKKSRDENRQGVIKQRRDGNTAPLTQVKHERKKWRRVESPENPTKAHGTGRIVLPVRPPTFRIFGSSDFLGVSRLAGDVDDVFRELSFPPSSRGRDYGHCYCCCFYHHHCCCCCYNCDYCHYCNYYHYCIVVFIFFRVRLLFGFVK